MFLNAITTLVLSVLVSVTAQAASKQVSNPFTNIQLVGLQILNSDGQDSFMRKIKKMNSVPKQLVSILQQEANTKIVSPIFELNEKSSFANIYVFVGQKTDDKKLELVQVLVNRSGSMFVIDMDIVKVEKKKLTMVHGTPDEQETYTAISTLGDLFK